MKVTFDPEVVPFEELAQRGANSSCAEFIYATSVSQREVASRVVGAGRTKSAPGTVRPDAEPKYELAQTAFRAIPMTELQAVRVNAWIAAKDFSAAERCLSPKQIAWLGQARARDLKALPNLIGVTLQAGWVKAREAFKTD